MIVQDQEHNNNNNNNNNSHHHIHGLRSTARLFTHIKAIHIHHHSPSLAAAAATQNLDDEEGIETANDDLEDENVAATTTTTTIDQLPATSTEESPPVLENIDSVNNMDSKSTPPQTVEKNAEMEQMKEKFAKLLLGEDMSGGGKGVSSALALSNAITNLAASVFGEQWRLEPMSAQRKARWRREIGWLLSVTDHIVEFVAKRQGNMEIMVTQQRNDLRMNIPALKKLDGMLIDCLDNFKDQSEFTYVSRDAPDSEKGPKRKEEKWWLPTAKVPINGLSDTTRKFLQYQKDCVCQVLKAAMAINAQVLAEMEIPENYIESLPKNGRSSLGDSIYKSITVEFFDPDQFLSTMELSSEHKILDLKNRIEASIVIWKRKMHQKDGKSGWGSAVSIEKREQFEDRAETILLIIKQRFPGIPQSSLEISKIQYNRNVGHAILESYSRILESLAHTVLSRIEDVLYADQVARSPTQEGKKRSPLTSRTSPTEDGERTSVEAPSAMTLSDFMGWEGEQNDNDEDLAEATEEMAKQDSKLSEKLDNVVTRRTTYLDNLVGSRSPTSRH